MPKQLNPSCRLRDNDHKMNNTSISLFQKAGFFCIPVLFFVLSLLFFSCNSSNVSRVSEPDIVGDTSVQNTSFSGDSLNIYDSLDIFYLTAREFRALARAEDTLRKIIFQFAGIKSSRKQLLAAWPVRRHQIEDTRTVLHNSGKAKVEEHNDTIFFGDQKLPRPSVRTILRELRRTGDTLVLFFPIQDSLSFNLRYDIYSSSTKPSNINQKLFETLIRITQTNPSPPASGFSNIIQ